MFGYIRMHYRLFLWPVSLIVLHVPRHLHFKG